MEKFLNRATVFVVYNLTAFAMWFNAAVIVLGLVGDSVPAVATGLKGMTEMFFMRTIGHFLLPFLNKQEKQHG